MSIPACIYLITNNLTGDRYIGKTIKTACQRFSQHKQASRRGSSAHICRALRKYGEDHFTLEILEETTRDEYGDREEFYIAKLKPEYNKTCGGAGGGTFAPGWNNGKILINNGISQYLILKNDPIPEGFIRGRRDPISKESKDRMSAAQQDRAKREKIDPSIRAKSQETKEKLSLANKGRNTGKPSPMRGKKTGKPSWNAGLKMNDEFCKKISISRTGYKASEDVRQRCIDREKIRGARQMHNKEAWDKISESHRKKSKLCNVTFEILFADNTNIRCEDLLQFADDNGYARTTIRLLADNPGKKAKQGMCKGMSIQRIEAKET